MDMLAPMIAPEIGVLTAITGEHDAGFESRAQKIAEKCKLFAGCRTIVCDTSEPDAPAALRRLYPSARIVEARGKDPIAGPLRPEMARVADVSTRIDVNEGTGGCLILSDNFTPDLPSLDAALDFMERRATAGRTATLIAGDLMHAPGASTEAVRSPP